jgi:hypothetical protein
MFQKQMFVEPYKTMIPVLTAQSFPADGVHVLRLEATKT